MNWHLRNLFLHKTLAAHPKWTDSWAFLKENCLKRTNDMIYSQNWVYFSRLTFNMTLNMKNRFEDLFLLKTWFDTFFALWYLFGHKSLAAHAKWTDSYAFFKGNCLKRTKTMIFFSRLTFKMMFNMKTALMRLFLLKTWFDTCKPLFAQNSCSAR